MGASCYLCERRYDTINGQIGGDAVGACKLCGVFACLAHGMRNANDPAFTQDLRRMRNIVADHVLHAAKVGLACCSPGTQEPS